MFNFIEQTYNKKINPINVKRISFLDEMKRGYCITR